VVFPAAIIQLRTARRCQPQQKHPGGFDPSTLSDVSDKKIAAASAFAIDQ
jgi:hypothetical protein